MVFTKQRWRSLDVPEKKKRGRPPLARPGYLGTLVSEERQSIHGAAKDETFPIPIDSATDNPAIPKKKRRGRPPLCRALPVDVPKTEQSERAIDNPNKVAKFVEKKGRGRPLGSLSKTVRDQNKPSTSFQNLLGPKRGRGRPRKTQLQLLTEASKFPAMSGLTKHITVRLTKMNEDLVMMARRKAQIKVENNTIIVEDRKEAKKETVKKKKKKIMVELEDIMKANKKFNPAEAASVTVVLEKRRGRPKKQQPNTETLQISHSSNTWSPSVKHETCQYTSDFTSHKEQAPTEVGVVMRNSEVLQDAHSSSVDPQGCLENGEVRVHQYSEWDTKPTQTVWTTDDGVESLDSNSVTQFVVGESLPPHPSQPLLPAQHDIQEDLLRELSDFRCQLTRELAATRVEVREGAELVRSAIAGVSAEIHRLGLILQPLANVIATGNLLCRNANFATVTSLLHPQQDSPPDDAVDVPQSSTHQKNSFACRSEDTPFNHLTPRDTPTDCSTESLPEIIFPVKTEDLTDNLQPCRFQAKSKVSLRVDTPITHSSFLPHHDTPKVFSISSSRKVAASPISDFSGNIPPPNMRHVNSLDCLQEDSASTHSALLSDHEAPTAASLGPATEFNLPASLVDVKDRSSQRDSPSIISAHCNDHDKSTVCSTGFPLEDSYSSESTECSTEDLSPCNEVVHPERDKDSVHQQFRSPAHSPGSFQEEINEVSDSPSFEMEKPKNAHDAFVPDVSSSPVTVPGSSTSNSTVITQDQEEMNFEEVSLKETLSKSSGDSSELSTTADAFAVPQSLCAEPKICTKMLLNFDIPSQSPPTSPLSCPSLPAMDGEVPPMLQRVTD